MQRARWMPGLELSGCPVMAHWSGVEVRFEHCEIAYRVAAVLALLLHDHAQAAADRACFFRITGRGQAWACP